MPSDLWRYDIGTNIWTWMKGDSLYQPRVYGTQGVGAPNNTPGGRMYNCSSWTDNNDLWLFGGMDAVVTNANFNDVWKFNITTNNWTWVGGKQQLMIPDNMEPNVYHLPQIYLLHGRGRIPCME